MKLVKNVVLSMFASILFFSCANETSMEIENENTVKSNSVNTNEFLILKQSLGNSYGLVEEEFSENQEEFYRIDLNSLNSNLKLDAIKEQWQYDNIHYPLQKQVSKDLHNVSYLQEEILSNYYPNNYVNSQVSLKTLIDLFPYSENGNYDSYLHISENQEGLEFSKISISNLSSMESSNSFYYSLPFLKSLEDQYGEQAIVKFSKINIEAPTIAFSISNNSDFGFYDISYHPPKGHPI